MQSRAALLALLVGASVASPVAADSLSPWGVWSDGARLRDSKPAAGPSYLGMIPPAVKRRPAVALAEGGARPPIVANAPETVSFTSGYEPGVVVIDTAARRLYYTLPGNTAFVYPIAVGKAGFTWTGVEKVSKVVDWPDWIPPDEMRARQPRLPLRMTGGLNNPLGAKAIYLGSSLYRIHGTNDAGSIGDAASSGCFRMHNEDVVHLASMVNEATTVHVLKRLPKDVVAGEPIHDAAPPAPPTPDQGT